MQMPSGLNCLPREKQTVMDFHLLVLFSARWGATAPVSLRHHLHPPPRWLHCETPPSTSSAETDISLGGSFGEAGVLDAQVNSPPPEGS